MTEIEVMTLETVKQKGFINWSDILNLADENPGIVETLIGELQLKDRQHLRILAFRNYLSPVVFERILKP